MDLFSAYRNRPAVTVEIGGQQHRVPQGITILQAMWYAGIPVVRGAGCLSGVCGACTTTWRLAGQSAGRTGMGCQTSVEDGMSIALYPIEPPQKKRYRMAELADPAEALFGIYPETRRCTLCDACTQVCPQDIPVRQGVRLMMNKDFAAVAPLFDECIMCGFCALVCESNIAPNLLGMYARKAVAHYGGGSGGGSGGARDELQRAMRRSRDGSLDTAWQGLLDGPPDALAARCGSAWQAATTTAD